MSGHCFSGTTWCSIGQRREKGRVQQGGARHCRISVKIRRLLRKNTQTWVLSSVAKFVYCVQTKCDRTANLFNASGGPIAVTGVVDLRGSFRRCFLRPGQGRSVGSGRRTSLRTDRVKGNKKSIGLLGAQRAGGRFPGTRKESPNANLAEVSVTWN